MSKELDGRDGRTVCLDGLFPPEVWPELNAVRAMATEAKAVKQGMSVFWTLANRPC